MSNLTALDTNRPFLLFKHMKYHNISTFVTRADTKKEKNLDFGWISGFHKDLFIKLSSSNLNAPNSN